MTDRVDDPIHWGGIDIGGSTRVTFFLRPFGILFFRLSVDLNRRGSTCRRGSCRDRSLPYFIYIKFLLENANRRRTHTRRVDISSRAIINRTRRPPLRPERTQSSESFTERGARRLGSFARLFFVRAHRPCPSPPPTHTGFATRLCFRFSAFRFKRTHPNTRDFLGNHPGGPFTV